MRIIKRETYVGKWHYGKKRREGKNPKGYQIEVKVPAIISAKTFDLAQRKRKTNATTSTRNTKREYLLARRCICGNCQTPMAAFTKVDRANEYPYYRCPVRFGQGTHYLYKTCHVKKNFRADYWDNEVWNVVKSFLSDPLIFTHGMKDFQSEQENFNEPIYSRIELIEELIEKRNLELQRLIDLYVSGDFPKEMLEERKFNLEEIIASLQDELESCSSQLSVSITDEQISELEEFSNQIAIGLIEADDNFETRRRIIDYLGIKVILSLEEAAEIAKVYCNFGHIRDIAIGKRSDKFNTSSHQLQSERSTNFRSEGEDNYRSIGKRSTGCRRS